LESPKSTFGLPDAQSNFGYIAEIATNYFSRVVYAWGYFALQLFSIIYFHGVEIKVRQENCLQLPQSTCSAMSCGKRLVGTNGSARCNIVTGFPGKIRIMVSVYDALEGVLK
jgi:hypothetical protein